MENGKLKIERWGFRQLLTSLAEWCENVGTHRMRPLAYVCFSPIAVVEWSMSVMRRVGIGNGKRKIENGKVKIERWGIENGESYLIFLNCGYFLMNSSKASVISVYIASFPIALVVK